MKNNRHKVFRRAKLILLATLLSSCSSEPEDPPVASLKLPRAETFGFHETPKSSQILYCCRSGDSSRALTLYEKQVRDTHTHDFEVIKEIALLILQEGANSYDPETQLLSIFGATISLDETLIPILGQGIHSRYPEVQLAALNALTVLQHDTADQLINEAGASNYPIIRLQACHSLASRGAKQSLYQIDALKEKLEPSTHPLFASLYGLIDNPEATQRLKRLMAEPDDQVRVASILTSASNNRDELLPNIRNLSQQINVPQQEACAFAFGHLKDHASIPKLKNFTASAQEHVALAAAIALYNLGQHQYVHTIEGLAKQGNLFAIHALAKCDNAQETLHKLLENPKTRHNTAIALLHLRDPTCTEALLEILINDGRDLAIIPTTSPGKSLTAWQIIPSAYQNLHANPYLHEITTQFREALLAETTTLPPSDFEDIAHQILNAQQNDLIPTLTALLVQQKSIPILLEHVNQPGAPLIRTYCNLALARLQQPGTYRQNLKEWVLKQRNRTLIEFRPQVPWQISQNTLELTPKEKSRLLIESIDTLASFHDEEGINTLIDVMRDGNPANRYALAGLLIRAVQ